MDGDEEVDFPFDLSEWTVVDEDVDEEKGLVKKLKSETLNKSNSSATPTKNEAVGNRTGLTSKNTAKPTASNTTSVTVKNVAKSSMPTSANAPAINVASITPTAISNAAKTVATSITSSNVSNHAKIVVKPIAPSSINNPVKNGTPPNTPGSAHVKNVARPTTPGNAPVKNVTSNTPGSAPVKNVATPTPGNAPVKNVATPTTPGSAPAKNVTSNTPGSAPAKNVTSNAPAKNGTSNTPVSAPAKNVTSNAPAKNVARPNTPASAPVKNVARPNTPVSALAKNVARPNTPVSAPVKNVARPNTPVSAPAKNVATPNTPVSAPAKNVATPNTSASAPAKNLTTPNTPVSAPVKNVATPNTSASAPAKNLTTPNTPASALAKNLATSSTPTSASASAKNVATSNTPTSAHAPIKNLTSNTPIDAPARNLTTSNTPTSVSVPAKNVTATLPSKAATVSEISSLFSGNKSQIKTSVVAQKVVLSKSTDAQKPSTNTNRAAVPLKTAASLTVKPTPTPNSSINPVSSTSSKGAAGPITTSASKPANTSVQALGKPTAVDQLASQSALSQAQTKSKAQVKPRTDKVGSIAEVMESVSKKADGVDNAYNCDMEDISDTEFTDTMDIAKYLVSKGAGVKREASPNKEGPLAKKTRMQTSAVVTNSSTKLGHEMTSSLGMAVSKQNQTTEVNSVKIAPQKQQSGKIVENVKQGVKKPVVVTSTPKGSFGAVKSPAMNIKSQPGVSQSSAKTTTVVTANKTNAVDGKNEAKTNTTPATAPGKRIIRRFHRTTQTVSKQCSNKLLQCLIRIPAIDALSKSKTHLAVQTTSEKARDEVFYQKALPDTVRPSVFKVISSFDVNQPGNRNIITGTFDYGISLGHITAVDLEKSMFRENLLTKSAHYNLYFDRQDFGVLDMLFAEEEQFVTVMTHIRKMKIGPRHLVVTYSKNLKENERDPDSSVSCIKATIIYNQNFASTSFLTHNKAPLWNKPKVEETMTIHNLPRGIPVDFLKLIIPDAITIELDDKRQKFSQEGSRVRLGMNRKNGGDRFLKLFVQMYINNECLALSPSGIDVSEVPELSDILKEKNKRKKEIKSRFSVREIKAVARDISGQPKTTEKDDVDVIMHVDAVDDVEKILTKQASAWKGPSSVEKLRQALASKVQPSTSHGKKNSSKNITLSDVSEDFSDISDASNIENKAGNRRKSQKKSVHRSSDRRASAATPRKTSKLSGNNSTTRQPNRLVRTRGPVAAASRSNLTKSRLVTLNDFRQRKEKPDRLQDEGKFRSPSKHSLDRSIHGSYSGRREKAEDEGRERYDRSRSMSGSHREKESYTHRQNVVETTASDKSESVRDRLHRERLQIEARRKEMETYDNFDSNQWDEVRSADDKSRHVGSAGRSERDDRRMEVNLEVDRHGNRIVSVYEKEPELQVENSFVQDRMSNKTRHEPMDRNEIYNDREGGRRGERLDRLAENRLGSLERQGRESRDKRAVRSRSPNTRLILRRRSASPRRGPPVPLAPARARRFSPAPLSIRKQHRFRRSQSPSQRPRGSGLSPISFGDDETRNSLEGMWLSQPPAHNSSQQSERGRPNMQTGSGLLHREEIRKSSLKVTNNRVGLQNEWKSANVSHGNEKEQLETNNSRFYEHYMDQAPGTGKTPPRSEVSSGRRSPSQFVPGVHDPSKFFEKIREIYGSGVNFTDSGCGIGPSESLNTAAAVPTGTQRRPRSGIIFSDSRAGSMSTASTGLRSLPNVSVNPNRGRGPVEPVQHFENRYDDYEENIDEADDEEIFDEPADNNDQMYRRESDMMPFQHSSGGGFRASGFMPNHPGPGGYHQNQNIPMPPPIPPPVAPPLFNSGPPPSQERMSHMDHFSEMQGEDMDNHQNNVSQNVNNQGMWNFGGSQMPGPRFGLSSMSFHGPPPPLNMNMSVPGPQGQNMNMSGPPHIRPTNIPPPHDVRGMNLHQPPWSHNNYF